MIEPSETLKESMIAAFRNNQPELFVDQAKQEFLSGKPRLSKPKRLAIIDELIELADNYRISCFAEGKSQYGYKQLHYQSTFWAIEKIIKGIPLTSYKGKLP